MTDHRLGNVSASHTRDGFSPGLDLARQEAGRGDDPRGLGQHFPPEEESPECAGDVPLFDEYDLVEVLLEMAKRERSGGTGREAVGDAVPVVDDDRPALLTRDAGRAGV